MTYEQYVKLRDIKGVRDADVARATGIPQSTFSDWKKGKSAPKQEKIQKISDFLGVVNPVSPSAEYSSLYLSPYGNEDGQSMNYYIDIETAKIAQEVFDNANLRVLFDAARDARPEDIKMVAEMLKRLKETNPDG